VHKRNKIDKKTKQKQNKNKNDFQKTKTKNKKQKIISTGNSSQTRGGCEQSPHVLRTFRNIPPIVPPS
jgi:hypothetical protein